MESACVCARAHVHARVPASSVSSSGSQTSISINIFRPIRGIKFVRMYNIKYVKKKENRKWSRVFEDLAANFGDFDAGADAILSRRATPTLFRFFWRPRCFQLEKEKRKRNKK